MNAASYETGHGDRHSRLGSLSHDQGGGSPDRQDARLDEALARMTRTGPALSTDRLAHHRETLMRQITASSSAAAITEPTTHEATDPGQGRPPRRWSTHRRRLVLGAAATLAAAIVTVPAAADQVQEWLHRAPTSVEEADRMQVVYNGGTYTWAQIRALQEQGKAMVTVEEPATYRKGIVHAFDTTTLADAWACTHVAARAGNAGCTNISSPTPHP